MKKKWLSKGICLAMSAVLLAGCSNGKTAETSTAPTEGNTAAQSPAGTTEKAAEDLVTLKWFMSINPVATDTDKVIEKLNEYTREKIGVEIDYNVIANPDYQQKMPIYINSGADFDICYTAAWTTNYLQFVSKDAFMDIKDLLPQYAKETYEFVPEAMWNAITVNGGIYGVPSYKEMGWQGGLLVNSDMAKEYGIDLTSIKTIKDYETALKTVKEKSTAEGKDVIGVSGMTFALTNPYESLTGVVSLPGVAKVDAFNNFASQTEEVFNQYATPEYMDYCKMAYNWYQAGYLPPDPVQYDNDTANRDNDFNSGKLFSYVISYAPGYAESAAVTAGHGVEFIPLMNPLFETRNAMGGILAISANSKHPDKALEFINLLNTDPYVGTLIRHGIEGVHHSAVGDNQVDKTMGGTLSTEQNGYDYTFGWQFGTPFNQKWDISYPDNIAQLFEEYNQSAVQGPHLGFTFDTSKADTTIAALTNVVEEYYKALETGMVDPEKNIPKFLDALNANGVEDLLNEVRAQLAQAN